MRARPRPPGQAYAEPHSTVRAAALLQGTDGKLAPRLVAVGERQTDRSRTERELPLQATVAIAWIDGPLVVGHGVGVEQIVAECRNLHLAEIDAGPRRGKIGWR